MIEEIIGIIKYNNVKKGSCFLVNEKYVFTARHVVQDRGTNQIIKNVVCSLKNRTLDINGVVVYDDYINDFAIVKLQNEVHQHFYKISRDVIEIKDSWESAGYPSNEGDAIYPYGYVIRKVNNQYELEINNEEDCADWSGMSGAPVIIENEIVGVVTDQRGGGNLKVTLMIATMENITENIDDKLLNDIYIGYHPLLHKRLNRVSDGCENIFYYTKENWKNGEVSYYIFNDNENSINALSENINLLIHDYGVDLVTEDEYMRSNSLKQREIEGRIEKKKNHIRSLIKENNQLIHILLWMLIEGNFEYIRIGSYIIDRDNNISRDVYYNDKNDSINIVLSSGYLDCSIIDLFEGFIKQLECYLDNNIQGKNVFIRDELVVKSLRYNIQNKINGNTLKEIIEEGKNLNLILLVGFDYTSLYSLTESNEVKLSFLKSYISDYEEKFSYILNNSSKIKLLNIEWIFLPFNSVENFSDSFKQKYL